MISHTEAGNLEQQIDSLMQCKSLKEHEVKLMCEKVQHNFNNRQKKFYKKKVMFNM